MVLYVTMVIVNVISFVHYDNEAVDIINHH